MVGNRIRRDDPSRRRPSRRWRAGLATMAAGATLVMGSRHDQAYLFYMNLVMRTGIYMELAHNTKDSVLIVSLVSSIVLIAGSVGTLAASSLPVREFYIVTESTSDAEPFWSHYVLDVKPDGQGSRVRLIRIAPDFLCKTSVVVEAASVVIPGVLPAQLSKGYDLCSVDQGALDRQLKTRAITAIDDSARFTVVAQCGAKSVVLNLPYPEQLETGASDTDRWLEFERIVQERAFGQENIFESVSYEKSVELQREGAVAVRELRAGLFDKGLDADCPALGPCTTRSFRHELDAYVGPVGLTGPNADLVENHIFARYVPAAYPPTAWMAHIGGPVKLDLTLDPNTGVVRDVHVVTGHPVLRDAAIACARQWQLSGPAVLNGRASATLEFRFKCLQPLSILRDAIIY